VRFRHARTAKKPDYVLQTSTSVRAKSVRFASSGSSKDLERAYAKQSPKLRAAGCRAFPYFRQAEPGDLDLLGVNRDDLQIGANQKKVELASRRFTSHGFQLLASSAMPVSSTLAAEINRVSLSIMRSRNRLPSGSAMTIREASRAHRSLEFRPRAGSRWLAEQPPAAIRLLTGCSASECDASSSAAPNVPLGPFGWLGLWTRLFRQPLGGQGLPWCRS
jgi:hypothetical protein